MLRRERLGWNNPLGGALSGPDAKNLNDLFQSLQNWLEFPLVGLEDADATLTTGVETALAWTVELYDDYTLHDANASTIKVPRQARTYLAVGVAGGIFAANSTGRRSIGWRKNGAATSFRQSTLSTNALAYVTVPFIGTVLNTDTLEVRAFQDSGGNLNISSTQAWVVYFPMGA